MKKLLTILMLAVAVIAVAPTAYAKTKKKAKSTSSASWNGDIPSASLILKMRGSSKGISSNIVSQLKQHGYKITREDSGDFWYEATWTKSGVCSISYFDGVEAADSGWEIEVYNSAACTKLYNDLRNKLRTDKNWDVSKEGSKISIFYSEFK